jgi:hypothetical protein
MGDLKQFEKDSFVIDPTANESAWVRHDFKALLSSTDKFSTLLKIFLTIKEPKLIDVIIS